MRSPRIRRAEPRDLDSLLSIEASWSTTPHWNRAHFINEIESPRSYFCVCESSGAVAGYGGICVIQPEAQVTTLAVRPDLAGRGLGARLLRHLHEAAARLGCSTATLEVSALNEPALRLYRSTGYAIVGRRRKYYNDGSDALLMTYRFPAAASERSHAS